MYSSPEPLSTVLTVTTNLPSSLGIQTWLPDLTHQAGKLELFQIPSETNTLNQSSVWMLVNSLAALNRKLFIHYSHMGNSSDVEYMPIKVFIFHKSLFFTFQWVGVKAAKMTLTNIFYFFPASNLPVILFRNIKPDMGTYSSQECV